MGGGGRRREGMCLTELLGVRWLMKDCRDGAHVNSSYT